MIITIDGPAGSGKSTAARGLAKRLQFDFLDTGAMYRSVTLICQREEIPLSDEQAVAARTSKLQIHFESSRVFVNGEDVTSAIRTTEVTQGTSHVAANVAVRERLVTLQRKAAAGRNIVTEGRDQGTVVFPDAECKFFLTAAPQERAARRQKELLTRGETVTLEDVLDQQTDRDQRDENRSVGPLRPAPDAILLDTSTLPAEKVLDEMTRIVQEIQAKGPAIPKS